MNLLAEYASDSDSSSGKEKEVKKDEIKEKGEKNVSNFLYIYVLGR